MSANGDTTGARFMEVGRLIDALGGQGKNVRHTRRGQTDFFKKIYTQLLTSEG